MVFDPIVTLREYHTTTSRICRTVLASIRVPGLSHTRMPSPRRGMSRSRPTTTLPSTTLSGAVWRSMP
jgi:hypothetical protein